MAGADSSTGGYLLATPIGPLLEDAALDAAVQGAIAGVTGMAGSLVRPRWPAVVPKEPDVSADWCAFGITAAGTSAPAIQHQPTAGVADPATDLVTEFEELDCLVSFYGPSAKANSGLLVSGLAVPQNCEALRAQGVVYVGGSREAKKAPELVNQQWRVRYDVALEFRRKVQRSYAVRNLETADVHVFDDTHVDEWVSVEQQQAE
jgi:hypothetical protein